MCFERIEKLWIAIIFVALTGCAAGTDGRNGIDGVDGKDGRDGIDGKNGQDGADGKNGIDGQNSTDPTEVSMGGVAGTSASGLSRPVGTAVCKWCSKGESTVRYNSSSLVEIFQCTSLDADGCGMWSLLKTCATGESFRIVYDETDSFGFPSRFLDEWRYECKAPIL